MRPARVAGLHWRLPRRLPDQPPAPPADGPVVLFLPARDEAPRIGAVLDRVPDVVEGRRVVALVVDDGSTDDTAAIARRHGAAVHSMGTSRGLGAAVATGLRLAVEEHGAAAVAFCDADGEYDPAELDRLVRPILAGEADYVAGSRFAGQIDSMRPHRRVGNRVLTRWVAWMCRRPVSDGQTGYRALSARAARDAELAHDYNYAQVLTLDLLARGYGYTEVPITYRFRESGRSFVRLGRYLRAVVPAVRQVLDEAAARDPEASPQSSLSVGLRPTPITDRLAGARSPGSPEASPQSSLSVGLRPTPITDRLAGARSPGSPEASPQSSTTWAAQPARAVDQVAASQVPS